MENASKALIIAGAILLSILIIGLGMFIYQQALSAIGNTGIDQQRVTAYNTPFTQYEGRQNGTVARQICSNVVAHNNTAADSSEFITVQTGDASGLEKNGADPDTTAASFNKAINAVRTGIRTGRMYTISFGYDPLTGLVVAIGITEVIT